MQLIKIFFHLPSPLQLRRGVGDFFFTFLPLYFFPFFPFLLLYLFTFNFLPFHFFTFSFFPFTQSNSVRVKKFQMSSPEEVGVRDEPARRDRKHNVLCRQFQRVEFGISTCCICQINVTNQERDCYKPFMFLPKGCCAISSKFIAAPKEIEYLLNHLAALSKSSMEFKNNCKLLSIPVMLP